MSISVTLSGPGVMPEVRAALDHAAAHEAAHEEADYTMILYFDRPLRWRCVPRQGHPLLDAHASGGGG